jgi:hypothetical protein
VQSRSAKFDAAIVAGVPQMVVLCTVVRRGVPVRQINLLPGASVTINETQAARRTFSGSVADDGTLAPHLRTDPLAPFSVELFVRCGVAYTDGVVETVPVGVFVLQSSKANALGQIDLVGTDRSCVITANLNETPYVIPRLTPLDEAIQGYLDDRYPGIPFTADALAHGITTGPAPSVYVEGDSSDPFTDCIDLANSFGREVFIGTTGGAVLQPIPDPTINTPVWKFAPGAANLAYAGVNTFDTTLRQVYNVVVVESSSSSSSPVTATAEVTDRTSPIYPDPLGFGRRPLYFQSSQLVTEQECLSCAQALLAFYSGRHAQPSFSAVAHPAHEAGDVVVYNSAALGVDLAVVLSSWTLQLDGLAACNYTTRVASSTYVPYSDDT